ncbi:PilZ domain-containing protein [Methylocystis parvus]|nr:PilZ domain-containing protein [Methylocystis parvus]WBJ98906.1 PilZ domain-containing protein [Methylocystis parvus OBBP]
MYAPFTDRSARNQAPGAEDRRAAPRLKSFSDVWADPGGMEPAIPCRVIDISTTGAKIDSPHGTLPDQFVLTVGHARHVAQVVWRRQTMVGVEFQKGVRPPRSGGKIGDRR